VNIYVVVSTTSQPLEKKTNIKFGPQIENIQNRFCVNIIIIYYYYIYISSLATIC